MKILISTPFCICKNIGSAQRLSPKSHGEGTSESEGLVLGIQVHEHHASHIPTSLFTCESPAAALLLNECKVEVKGKAWPYGPSVCVCRGMMGRELKERGLEAGPGVRLSVWQCLEDQADDLMFAPW